MDKDLLMQRLMATFLGELEDHVRALNDDLLALEKGPAGEARAELLKLLFRSAHSLKGAAHAVSIDPIESACHSLEEILGAIRDGALAAGPELLELLFATADALGDAGKRIAAKTSLAGGPLASILPRLARASRPASAAPPSPRAATPAPARAAALPRPAPAPVPAAVAGAVAARDPPPSSGGLVRVRAQKLDALLARTSELLVGQRTLDVRAGDLTALIESIDRWRREWRAVAGPLRSLVARAEGDDGLLPERAAVALSCVPERLAQLRKSVEWTGEALARDARALRAAAARLDEEVRRVRMLPFAEACEGIGRAARDLGRATGKEIDLVLAGGDVELDRSILEGIADPLLHLVRNAVDHGGETAAERRAAGKPPGAQISVTATLHGASVKVTVEDDGRGLDLDAIRAEARRRRLPAPTADHDAARLIFHAGFSTAKAVTTVSGRGIGLDVVKSRVEALHGTVDVSSERGRGACFTLTLPLTVTTLRALLVSAGGQTLALPGACIERLARLGPDDFRPIEGREMAILGGAPVPVASLARILGFDENRPGRPSGKVPVVVIAAAGRRAVLVVDGFLGEQELMVKSLGARLRRVRHVAGAAVLPDGKIALILTAADLIRSAIGGAPGQELAPVPGGKAVEARKRIIVVDDSVTTRTLVKTILEAAGYDVAVAFDGAEAWRLLQERGADAVVSDVEMPRLDGFGLTEAIRGSKRLRELPVILVTALATDRDRARGLEVGADAYLLKSAFDQRELLRTIGQLL